MNTTLSIQSDNKTTFNLPIASLFLCAVCTLLYWIFGAMPDSMILHNNDGQKVWQWLTSHWVHISKQHLVWNLAAFLVLGSIIEQASRRLLLSSLAMGTAAVNLYLGMFYSLNAYAGLSGVLNSLLIVALYCLYQQAGYRMAAVVTLLLSVAKIIVEMLTQSSLFSTLPWPPVPEAHLAGLLGGFLLVVILKIRKRRLRESHLVNFDSLPAIKRPYDKS